MRIIKFSVATSSQYIVRALRHVETIECITIKPSLNSMRTYKNREPKSSIIQPEPGIRQRSQ